MWRPVRIRLAAPGGFIDNIGLDGDAAAGRIEKDVNFANIEGVRAQLRVLPSDRLDVTFKVVRQQTYLNGTQNVDVDPSRGGTPNPDIPAGVVLSGREQYRRGAEPYHDGITVLNGDAAWHLGGFDVISSTSYTTRQQNADIDFSNAIPTLFGIGPLSHPGLLLNRTRVKDFVQEIRLVSSDKANPFQWIVGGFFDTQRKLFGQDLVSQGVNADNGGAFGSDNLLHTVAHFHDTQLAAFGEASYRLGDLTATAGLRYFNFKSVYDIVGDGAGLGGPLSLIGRGTKDHGFNPKFNLSYKPDANRLFYVQASRGFRLGGINDPLLAICSAADAASLSPRSVPIICGTMKPARSSAGSAAGCRPTSRPITSTGATCRSRDSSPAASATRSRPARSTSTGWSSTPARA